MSRRRYISSNISLDRRVNQLAIECGDFAALLYTWMIPHAEDDCSITADPGEILVLVMPWRRDKSELDVQAALDGMVRLGLLERCEDPTRLRFPPSSFYRYQAYIGESRRIPAPAAPQPAPDAAPTPPSVDGAPECADLRQNAPKVAQNRASVSSSVSISDSVIPSGGSRVADADAPAPQEELEKSAKKPRDNPKRPHGGPDLAPLVDAFRAAGLPDPFLERGEGKAAQILLRHIPPEDIAACWQDYASGIYGDDWERRNLSFAMLANNQRAMNWRRWRDNGRMEGCTDAKSGYSQRSHI